MLSSIAEEIQVMASGRNPDSAFSNLVPDVAIIVAGHDQ